MPHPPSRAPTGLVTQIAETATLAVRAYLATGQVAVAVPLQAFAAAAWDHARGDADLPALLAEVRRALAALRQVDGAREPRAFLTDVAALLRARIVVAGGGPGPVAGLDDLPAALRAAGGAASVRLADLRRLAAVPRLDADGRDRLARELSRRGVAASPCPLPRDARRWVRLHLVRHPVAAVLRAARTPGPRGDRMLGLGTLRVGGPRPP